MSTKCYIVDYDRKIDKFKNLLNDTHNSVYNNLYYNKFNNDNSYFSDKKNYKLYLDNINNYLDEILNMPGMTKEDIYNIKNDQNEIVESINTISNELNRFDKNQKDCLKIQNTLDRKIKKKKPVINKESTDELMVNDNNGNSSGNITININSGEKKTTIVPERKYTAKKININ